MLDGEATRGNPRGRIGRRGAGGNRELLSGKFGSKPSGCIFCHVRHRPPPTGEPTGESAASGPPNRKAYNFQRIVDLSHLNSVFSINTNGRIVHPYNLREFQGLPYLPCVPLSESAFWWHTSLGMLQGRPKIPLPWAHTDRYPVCRPPSPGDRGALRIARPRPDVQRIPERPARYNRSG